MGFSPHQSVNSFPGCLSHLQLIQNSWEDGAILSPVNLQRACAHNLDTILVQRDCQVVWNLASYWYDAAATCLEKTPTLSAMGVPSSWMNCAITAFISLLKMIFSFLLSMDAIRLFHKEINGLNFRLFGYLHAKIYNPIHDYQVKFSYSYTCKYDICMCDN